MLDIKEDPLDSRQQHLDVVCFPVLFPDGRFGKYYKHETVISHCEYMSVAECPYSSMSADAYSAQLSVRKREGGPLISAL